MTQNTTFPYQNISSLFPAANQITALIAALPERDWSHNVADAAATVTHMGAENGFAWLWTPEERAVAATLKSVFAGPRTAHYGWRLYARYRKQGKMDAESIGY